VGWPEIHRSFTALLQDNYRALLAPTDPAAPRPNPELQKALQSLIDAAPAFAKALPGLLALEALAGVTLACAWHHRLAVRPLGRRPEPFRRFRFNDQLIWGAIFSLVLLVAPLPEPWTALASSLVVFAAGVYTVRGLAVAAALLARAPRPSKLFAGLLAILLLPIALGLCLAVGLADTWLDIRRRLQPPELEGAS
jgi:Predicted membrane protein (DUF2232)